MGPEKETRPLYLIGFELNMAGTILRNVYSSVDHLAAYIDDSPLYPNISTIKKEVEHHIRDSKSALAKLENIEEKLRKLETEENAKR